MKRLSLVGLGIVDERSIPLRGLELVRKADRVYCEFFTSILKEGSVDRLRELAGRRIEFIDRRELEEAEVIMKALAKVDHVCLLTAGDPLTATTHQELRMDAVRSGCMVEIVHSGSIFTAAAGACGLQHYKFGRTTTLGFPEGDYFPTSPLEMISDNTKRGLHTLVLLDIQADRGRYMTVDQACTLLMEMEKRAGQGVVGPSYRVIGIARAGRPDQRIVFDTISSLSSTDLGPPPHCIIVPGDLHFMEEELLMLVGGSG